MLSSVGVVFGRPEHASSPKLLRPRFNSAAQNFTLINDGAVHGADGVFIHKTPLIFDLRRHIAFQKQIPNDTKTLSKIITTVRPK